MAELGTVAHRGPDVDHRGLTDEHVLPEGDGARLDHSVMRPIAHKVRIFTDDRAITNGEQVGTDGSTRGQYYDPAPDFRAQRTQIQRVQGRTDEQDHRVGDDHRLDD